MSASGFTDWLKIPSHVSTFSVFAVENISWSGGHGKLLYHDSYSIKMFGALDYRWVATVWGPELAWSSNYSLPRVATADSTVGTSIVRLYFLWKCSLFSFLSFVFAKIRNIDYWTIEIFNEMFAKNVLAHTLLYRLYKGSYLQQTVNIFFIVFLINSSLSGKRVLHVV